MVRKIRRWVVLSIISILLFLSPFGMSLADFPEKPVTVIVGRGTGGSTDVIARTFAPFFGRHLGVPVIVRNVKGAGGQLALREVSRTSPDGYTLIVGVFVSDIIKQLLQEPDYDIKAFTYIYGIAGGDTNGLIVSRDSPVHSFSQLLQAAKKKTVTIAGTGIGSNSWLLAQFLKQKTGLAFTYVPFDSGKEATIAVMGGHVTAGVANSINFPGPVRQGAIRVLGVASSERLKYLPSVSTFTELGYGSVKIITRQVLLAPPGLSALKQAKLASAAARAVSDPEFLQLAEKQGFSVDPLTAVEARNDTISAFTYVSEVINISKNR